MSVFIFQTRSPYNKRGGARARGRIGGKVYLGGIVHGIEKDLIYRGGGPTFYKAYKEEETELKAGGLIFVSSVSGRTAKVVELSWDCMQNGVSVIALTSLTYAKSLDPVRESGIRLHEFVTLPIDNCAPMAEAMLDVDGIEPHYENWLVNAKFVNFDFKNYAH